MLPGIMIAACGATGAVLRGCLQLVLNGSFPIGTWIANILGCFLAGFITNHMDSGTLKQSLIIGLCGALTTLSSVCIETLLLFEQKRYLMSVLHFFAMGLVGLSICFFGLKSSIWISRWGMN